MKLIDKDALVAEIERRMENAGQYSTGAYNGMKEIRDYINSLSEEPVSEELEEAAYYNCIDRLSKESIEDFKAGAQWQKEHSFSDPQINENIIYAKGYKQAEKDAKQNTIHGHIERDIGGQLIVGDGVEYMLLDSQMFQDIHCGESYSAEILIIKGNKI